MFANPTNFRVDNSRFTNVVNNNHPPGPTGIDILLAASAPEAEHDSSARDTPPRCFPGTRKQFVEDIVHWAVPPIGDTPLPIYWMKGPAGVGKSAVAQTCVEELKRQGQRCPAFFFSINGPNKYQKLFPSIAYQLASINSDYHDLIDKKIRRNRTLVDKTMETQLWTLLIEPLQELEEQGKGIGERIPVFVDGLDECESQDAQCEIIDIIASATRDNATPLCWAFFSRPEPHIEATFSKPGLSELCHMTTLPVSRGADRDIELYLRASFERILQRLNITIDSPWPSDSDIEKLVGAAGGLFIYAKTVLRFVGRPGSLNPTELLHAIITVISSHDQRNTVAESAFAKLDAFYTLIMQRIPTEMFPTIHRVLAALCRYPYSSVITIANLLHLPKVEFEAACNQLGAVVYFQRQHEPLRFDPTIDLSRSFLYFDQRLPMEVADLVGGSLGGSIFFYHKSFRDFLRNRSRSGIYCISGPRMRDSIYEGEWNLLSRFQKSVCWQGSVLVRAPDTPDSTPNLSYPYTNEFVNSLVEAYIFGAINGKSRPFGADLDFRKQLRVVTHINISVFGRLATVKADLYRCSAFRKYAHKTMLAWFQPGEFPRFDIARFKKYIAERGEFIQPYPLAYPSLGNSQAPGRVESGLYVVGRDSGSIFWYWEINYDFETYREFHALDLAEGEKLYREEWPVANKE